MNVDISHWVDVGSLRTLLGEIPYDYTLWPNAVNNLSIYDTEDNYMGYIDLLHGCLAIHWLAEELG